MPATENLLHIVTSAVNIDILNLVRHEASSPRELARFLEKDETDVSRRLRLMERAGIVKGNWSRKDGKNVKIYSLLGFHAEVDLGPEGLKLQLKTSTGAANHVTSGIGSFEIPSVLSFIGRREQIDLLSSEEGLHVIIGLPGIGKTSLGATFAASVLRDRPVLWHTIREVDSFGYVVDRIAVFLARFGFDGALNYVRGGGEEDRVKIELIGKGLDKIKAVIIFDDYHRKRDERLDALLEHLWKDCSATKIIILSRSRPKFYSLDSRVREHWLQGLSLGETRELLFNRGVEADSNQTTDLWRKISGHPLSLTLFCSLAKDKTISIATDTVGQREITEYFIKELYSGLGSEERELLTALSIFRTAVHPKALSEVFHLRKVSYLLHSLEARMLVMNQGDKFVIHDLLRQIFYRFFDEPAKAHTAVAKYYLKLSTTEQTLEAIYHLLKSGDMKTVTTIIKEEVETEIHRFVENGYAAPLIATLQELKEPLTQEDKFYLLCLKGKARSKLGEWEPASKLLTEALGVANSVNEKSMLAHATKCFAEHYYWKGDYTNTEKKLLEATKMFEQLGMLENARKVYSQLARLYFSMGRHDKAISFAGLAQNTVRHIKNITPAGD